METDKHVVLFVDFLFGRGFNSRRLHQNFLQNPASPMSGATKTRRSPPRFDSSAASIRSWRRLGVCFRKIIQIGLNVRYIAARRVELYVFPEVLGRALDVTL